MDGSQNPVVLYFFFNRRWPDKSHSDSAYRAFVSQVLQQCHFDEVILDAFTFSMMSNDSGQSVASRESLHELLARATQYLGELFIVLDAVDECVEPNEFLNELFELISKSRLKLLVFSRPNVGISRKRIKARRSFLITRDSTKRGLITFFTSRVQQLLDGNLLSMSSSKQEMVAQLVHGADGMFLWGRLMISHLSSLGLGITRRLRTIQDIRPEASDRSNYQSHRPGALARTSPVEASFSMDTLFKIRSHRRSIERYSHIN